ncbi:MAG: hypothetical protein H6636_02455 [Anaerolineales bacterium]|nr:hypothetical protein [Anaerolineales bacterium]
MTPSLRELLTDLKAAALIGHPESLASALDGIRALDDEELPPSALLPLGRALTPLAAKTLKPLYVDDDPAIRALVSVALGERYMQGKDVTSADLGILAEDPNPEVTTALARASSNSIPHPEKLIPLAETWLKPTSQQISKSPNHPIAQSQTRPARRRRPQRPPSFSPPSSSPSTPLKTTTCATPSSPA